MCSVVVEDFDAKNIKREENWWLFIFEKMEFCLYVGTEEQNWDWFCILPAEFAEPVRLNRPGS